jgi:hypothetical protein
VIKTHAVADLGGIVPWIRVIRVRSVETPLLTSRYRDFEDPAGDALRPVS